MVVNEFTTARVDGTIIATFLAPKEKFLILWTFRESDDLCIKREKRSRHNCIIHLYGIAMIKII